MERRYKFLLMSPEKCATIIFNKKNTSGILLPGIVAKLAYYLDFIPGVTALSAKILSPPKYKGEK